MENNLLNDIKAYFNTDVIDKLSAHIGTSSEQVQKGVDLAVPSLLLGLQGSGENGLATFLNSAKHLFGSLNLGALTSSYFGAHEGADTKQFESDNLVANIFGDKLSGIVESIGGFIGLDAAAFKKILGASLPAVIAGLTHKGANWDLGRIKQSLDDNKASFAAALPSTLGLGIFGSLFAKAETPIELEPAQVTEVPKAVAKEPYVHSREQVKERTKGAGIWWILIPLVLLAAWFFFGRGCSGAQHTDGTAVDTAGTEIRDTMAGAIHLHDTIAVKRDYVDVKLPNGSTVRAYPSGIEDRLIQFLESDYKTLSTEQLKDKWFDFDNLNFETGTANITQDSEQQLHNIAAILGLFPDAKIKIGGYTDKTGDEAINKRVSQQRADAVKDYLTRQGLGSQVLDAEGYGSEFATVPSNATDRERAKDRRVAISVRK